MLHKLKEKINSAFWKPDSSRVGEGIRRVTEVKTFENQVARFEDEKINEAFNYWNKLVPFYDGIITIDKKVWIEPMHQEVITGFNRIKAETIYHVGEIPSSNSYIKAKLGLGSAPVTKMDKVVLIDASKGQNYFHLFSAALNKIWLLDKYGVDKNLPLAIGSITYNTKVFQYLLNNTALGNYNWYLQKQNQYIETTHAVCLLCNPYEQALWQQTAALVNNLRSGQVPTRKIFLTRTPKAGRHILNMAEVEPLLKNAGFEIIDTSNLSFPEQVKLFSETTQLIAIHGAGMANIMFSQAHHLKVLEICPANRISTHFYWLSKALKVARYDCILGGNIPAVQAYPEGGFTLEIARLEKALQRLNLN